MSISVQQVLPAFKAFVREGEGLVNHPLSAIEPATFDFELVRPVVLEGFAEQRATKVTKIISQTDFLGQPPTCPTDSGRTRHHKPGLLGHGHGCEPGQRY